MGIRAARLFEKLSTFEALKNLIGKSENSELECKQWSNLDANRSVLAKAACGLANAEGGVIIIGMDARGRANKPDLIEGFACVSDTHQVAILAREIISEALEPGIKDIEVREIPINGDASSGCVVIYIAEEDGYPRRVKKGNHFFVRMASGTLPMLYTQLADRFGRRPHPKLVVETTELIFVPPTYTTNGIRTLGLFIFNSGRGSARFTVLRCEKDGNLTPYSGPHVSQPPRWPHSDDGASYFSYRATSNDVVHPGEKIWIALLSQHGKPIGLPTKSALGQVFPSRHLFFNLAILRTSVICDGMPAYSQSFEFEEFDYDPEKQS